MPFLPLHDSRPRVLLEYPWVTWGIIAVTSLVYLFQISLPPEEAERLTIGLGVVPATLVGEVTLRPEFKFVSPVVTLLTALFLHGSFMHILGNMLYLWVFGDNVEDAMGHLRFAGFYLLCGVLAGLAQVAAASTSLVPTIGASGAISAILGAYLVLYPRARVLIPIYFIPVYLPAYLLLVFWIGFQLLSAWSAGSTGGSVAWWAHIGGFVAGVLLIVPFRYNSVPLFSADDPPSGLRLKPRPRRDARGKDDGDK